MQVKMFQFAKCTFSLIVIAGVVLSDPPDSPCPELFQYKFDGSDWLGLIELNNIKVNETVVNIIAQLSLPTSLPSLYKGRIDLLEEQQQAVQAVLQSRPLVYRISFPLKNPIPRVTRIVVNDDVLCSGPPDQSPQMTGFQLHHVFYPNRSEYPRKTEGPSNGNEDATAKDASSTFSRISQQKCNEYKSLVYEAVTTDGGIRTDRCVNAHVLSSDTENENALPGEFPHMALIGYDIGEAKLKWGCNGVLVSEEYVLTAGHCVRTVNTLKPKSVRFGVNINKDNADDAIEISKLIPHPEYNPQSRYNDIGLIKLHQKIKFSSYIRPACLSTTHQLNSISIGTGWGATEFLGEFSGNLRKVKMDIVSQDKCQDSYKNEINRKLQFGAVPLTQICVEPHHPGRDLCEGSTGSPLQQPHNQHYCMYTVTGISSFGVVPCGVVGVPTLYTKVYSYLGWIEGVVWANSS